MINKDNIYEDYETEDPIEQSLLLAYCEGKSFVYNVFFGWRSGAYTKNGVSMTFRIAPSKLNFILMLAKDLRNELK